MRSNLTQTAPLKLWAALLFVLLPVVALYGLALPLTTGLPEMDDYDQILSFLDSLKSLPSFSDRFWFFLAHQHNEYKLFFEQLLFVLDYRLQGHIDLLLLQRVSDLFLLPFLGLLWLCFLPGAKTAQKTSLPTRLFLFAPVSYLIFSMRDQEVLNWAMGGLQQIPVFPFAIAALLLLSRPGLARFCAACTMLALAIATSGNGFFLAPVGLCFLLQQRRIKAVAAWCGLTLSLAAVYSYQFYRVPHNAGPASGVALKLILFPVVFLGGAGSRVPLAIVLGLVLLAFTAYLVRLGWRTSDPVTFYLAGFVLLTAAGVTATRYTFGLESALSSRYGLYSQLLIALLYMAWLHLRARGLPSVPRRRLLLGTFAAVTVLSCAKSDWNAERDMRTRFTRIQDHYAAWSRDPSVSLVPDEIPEMLQPDWVRWRANAEAILRQAQADGVYKGP